MLYGARLRGQRGLVVRMYPSFLIGGDELADPRVSWQCLQQIISGEGEKCVSELCRRGYRGELCRRGYRGVGSKV